MVGYGSHTLSKAERNHCVTRRELLAMVYFVEHFRPYFGGRKFTLHTDHGAQKWLQSFESPEGQMARWLEKLQDFDFVVVHQKGKKHLNADALSWLPCVQCGQIGGKEKATKSFYLCKIHNYVIDLIYILFAYLQELIFLWAFLDNE